MSIYKTYPLPTYGPSGVSLSVPDPFISLITDPSSPREFIFRGYPKDSNGNVVNVDRSSSGYTSRSTDTPYQFFPEGIQKPYNFSVQLPQLYGSTQLGVGDFVALNKDGSLDSAAQLDWLAAQSDLYLGPPEPATFAEFTRIFKGTSAGTVWDLDSVTWLHRDLRFKLQKTLQRNRYKGTGPAIRGNGSTTRGTATLNCPAGAMTIQALLRPNSVANAVKYIAGYQNAALAGGRLFRFTSGANNRLELRVINDAGTQFEIHYDNVSATGYLKQWTAVLDPLGVVNGSPRLYLYVDGEEAATPVAISGTFNSILNAFAILSRPDSASLYGDIDLDDLRLWNYARTQIQIKSDKDRELLGTETGLIGYWKFNEGSGLTASNSVSGQPALTLTSPVWVGSLEGDSSLAGTVKPVGLGLRRQVQPKWVDTQRLVLQFHDGSMQDLTALRDSADALTFGSDVTDIYSVTPSAGTWNRSLSMGLVRLGSSPVGTITGDIKGDNSATGYADTAAEIHLKLMVDFGGLDVLNEIDTPAYTLLDSSNSAVIGLYYDQEVNIDVAADDAVKSILAWGGPTRTGISTVGKIRDPSNLTPTVEWTQNDLDQSAGQPYRREPFGVRARQVIIGYKPYHTVLSTDQIAGIVSLNIRDDYGKQYRYVRSIDSGNEDALVITILTNIDDQADAQRLADEWYSFLSRDLDRVTIALDEGSLNHYVGTIASLQIEQEEGSGVYRYNTAGGKKYAVIGVIEDMGQSGSPDRFQAVMVG